jgi:hypothetical protein
MTRKRTLGTVFALALTIPLAVQQGFAQAPSINPLPGASETVNLTMEQRHVIREIIVKDMKTPPQEAAVAVEVGKVVPAGVQLQPLPVEVSAKVPQVRTHSFFVRDQMVVIVDPKDNKIAAVVE